MYSRYQIYYNKGKLIVLPLYLQLKSQIFGEPKLDRPFGKLLFYTNDHNLLDEFNISPDLLPIQPTDNGEYEVYNESKLRLFIENVEPSSYAYYVLINKNNKMEDIIVRNYENRYNVENIIFNGDTPIIKTSNEKIIFDKVIVACGAFSKKLTDNLNEKIPLDTERGYHVHFKNCEHLISRPVVFANRGFGMTPMEQGLRVVGTVEFGGLDNPLSKSRIKNLIDNAKYMLDGLPEHEDEWLGFRPTLPDFLPIIGCSKNHKNVYYSFGHHHLGWTLGAISGKIVSKMISGEKTNLDLKPYSSVRFS